MDKSVSRKILDNLKISHLREYTPDELAEIFNMSKAHIQNILRPRIEQEYERLGTVVNGDPINLEWENDQLLLPSDGSWIKSYERFYLHYNNH
jgi:hypothetical protein